jgi:hypothetical protein
MLKSAFRFDKLSLVPNIVHHDYLLYSYISSPTSIITGYMYPGLNMSRTGALKLTSAIQTCNAKSILEIGTREGEKTSKDGTTDDSDTTLFYHETVGNIKYAAEGSIDLMLMQFVPCDTMFNRYQFNPDYFNIYKELLKRKLANFNSDLGYYQLKNTSIQIPEYGYLFSNENVLSLTKESLKRLLLINITRKGAYARISSLKIKLVTDPLIDTPNNENGWIDIKTEEDINNLNFDTYMYYEVIDTEKARELREDFSKKIDEAKKQKEADKKQKAAEKKEKKEAEMNNKKTENV